MHRKENILQAATVMFGSRGFKDTSMVEVAEMAEVASATVFYHFKTKEDLLLAILQRVKDGIQHEFATYTQGTQFDSGFDRLKGTISFYLYLASCKEEWFLMLHRSYPYRLAMESDDCRHYLEDIYNCFIDLFEVALAEGQRDGSVRELVPRKIALLLLSMLEGIMRFKYCHLYDSGTLYDELFSCVDAMVAAVPR